MPTITISDETILQCLAALRHRREDLLEMSYQASADHKAFYEERVEAAKTAHAELLKAQARSEG